jgi:hypothetical protein
MHFARHYENRTLLAIRSKRVIARKLKSRKNTGCSVVKLQKTGEISGVLAVCTSETCCTRVLYLRWRMENILHQDNFA